MVGTRGEREKEREREFKSVTGLRDQVAETRKDRPAEREAARKIDPGSTAN
jgi:hypothetical protein